jgi:hypothetical protein
MLSLAAGAAMSNRFPAAYVLFAVCLIWAEGVWFDHTPLQ